MEGGAFFESMYEQAGRNPSSIPWASLAPTPLLGRWLAAATAEPGRAVVVGCGLGDDAEALSGAGWNVTAFDISATAIAWARERFPESSVHYAVADLFALPASWSYAFSLVVEALTIQSLAPGLRRHVVTTIAELVAPGGSLLVSAVGHHDGPRIETGPPWPLLREDLAAFGDAGLTEVVFDTRPSPWDGFAHFEVEYHRPAGADVPDATYP